jgi:hypothetical protein
MFSNLILSFSTPNTNHHTFSMQLTQTHGRGKVKPTRFELEYYMIVAFVFLDSKLQVEEKIIDR